MRITVAASAKVNLWLRVGPRQPPGFHAIDTLFCSLHLADSVVVGSGRGRTPSLDVAYARPIREPPELGPVEENLAYRAAVAFVERAGLDPAPAIRLVKRIPVGAGLGGGSSDAAAVLRALARLNPGAVPREELLRIGAKLGSDVPFFVRGAPVAHATGRGERLAAMQPLEVRSVVVAIPDFSIATGEAYSWLDEDRNTPPSVATRPRHQDPELSWETVAEEAVNHFEPSVFRRHPRLERVRDQLRERGARPALLAGSGSTVFGVFESRADAERTAEAIPGLYAGMRALVTRTRMR